MEPEGERDGLESDRQVHVRTLGMGDTLRWAWEVLTDRLELVGLALAVGLVSVVTTLGVSQSSPDALPEFAGWVWPLYFVFLVAVVGVWAVVYRVAADAVANQSRPLGEYVRPAVGRIPALVVAGILMGTVSFIGLIFLVLPGVYLFHRLLLAYPAIVIDEQGPIEGLTTSWGAAGGSVLKVFGISFGYYALVGVVNAVSSVFGPYTVAGGVVNAVGSAVLIPLFGLALGHLYLERTRNAR